MWTYKLKNLLATLAVLIGFASLIVMLLFAFDLGKTQKAIIDERISNINTLSKKHTIKKCESITLKLIGVTRKRYSNAEDYDKILSYYFNLATLLAGVVTTITALFEYYRYRTKLKKDQSIQTYELSKNGDDLKIMLKYYKSATNVTVYSGDFSWLNDDPSLRNIVLRLNASQKIKFYSSKSQSEIIRAITQATYDHIRPNLVHDNQSNIKCSLIDISGGMTLLYKTNSTPNTGHKDKICIVRDKHESRYLLGMIKGLMKA